MATDGVATLCLSCGTKEQCTPLLELTIPHPKAVADLGIVKGGGGGGKTGGGLGVLLWENY